MSIISSPGFLKLKETQRKTIFLLNNSRLGRFSSRCNFRFWKKKRFNFRRLENDILFQIVDLEDTWNYKTLLVW